MKLKVKIIYRDDKEEIFNCIDYPQVSDWIILFLDDLGRIIIPRDAVGRIVVTV